MEDTTRHGPPSWPAIATQNCTLCLTRERRALIAAVRSLAPPSVKSVCHWSDVLEVVLLAKVIAHASKETRMSSTARPKRAVPIATAATARTNWREGMLESPKPLAMWQPSDPGMPLVSRQCGLDM